MSATSRPTGCGAPFTPELEAYLSEQGTPFELAIESGTDDAADRSPATGSSASSLKPSNAGSINDWKRIEPRLRTSIVEGISVFLSLFDDNPAVKRVFCPPKETYDPVANADGRYGRPLPPFGELD